MKTSVVLLVTLAAITAAPSARADTIAVYLPNATNVSAGDTLAIGELLGRAIAATAGVEVIGPTSPALEGRMSPAPASPLRGGRHVLSSVVKIGNALTIRAWLMEGSSLRHQASIEARSLDDVPAAVDRIARALVEGKTTEQARTIDNVTAKEAAPVNRTFTERRGGLYTMPVLPFGGARMLEPSIGVGLDIHLIKRTYFYEVGAGFLIPTGNTDRPGLGGVYAELGAGRFLSAANTGAYFVGGVSPRIWGGFNDAIMGFAPYVGLGAAYGRESSASLFFDVRVAQNLVPFKVDDEFSGEEFDGFDSGETVFPTELGVRVGIQF